MNSDTLFMHLIGDGLPGDLEIRRARVSEGMSQVSAISIELLSRDRGLSLAGFLGKKLRLAVRTNEREAKRYFGGICISAEYLGTLHNYGRYLLEIRSGLWLLGRRRDNRVFQDQNTPDIIQKVLGDHALSGSLKLRLDQSYAKREYCLQFGESDFDFLSRLMEEEGISYYFTCTDTEEQIVLSDGISGHDPLPGNPLEYLEAGSKGAGSGAQLIDLQVAAAFTTGKVTLGDHNFELSTAAVTAVRNVPKGGHGYKEIEHYQYPGNFRQASLGEDRARVEMEAQAARRATLIGLSDAGNIANGGIAKIKGHQQLADPEYLVISAEHHFQIDPLRPEATAVAGGIDLPPGMESRRALTRFGFIPKAVPFRAPLLTPWPSVPGVLTALVVGPAGDEIHTDKYGRVRVQFFWDRLGKKDDKAGVFVRVAQPWTGKNWGMQSIPRIGQEVLVSFENGDPDRPIILGMLYNANTMPPWALPGNQTQTGIRTNSSKGGGGYNELMFEDKKDAEKVFFQSERDYEQKVKNNAVITVGLEHKEPGDMTVTIRNNLTEKLNKGDHTFTVAEGHQKIDIKQNKTETIDGNQSQTVRGNSDTTIQDGNMSQTISKGNFSLKTTLGKVEIEAMQEILLKVGQNSIKIDQVGITVTGAIVKVEGKALIEAKAPVSNVKADGVLILKGGITMIN